MDMILTKILVPSVVSHLRLLMSSVLIAAQRTADSDRSHMPESPSHYLEDLVAHPLT